MWTYGQELLVDTLGYMLGAFAHVCATPPTSIVGVILWAGYFGETVLSHFRAGHFPIVFVFVGLCLPLTVRVTLGLRDKSLRLPTPV